MKRLILLALIVGLLLLLHGRSLAAITDTVGSTCTAAGGGTAITCNVPGGTVNNDFLVFYVSYYTPNQVTPSGTGWTGIQTDDITSNAMSATMGKCASSEGATETLTISSSTGLFGAIGVMVAYHGTACPSFPIDVSANGSRGSSTSVSIPVLVGTTAKANEWASQFAGIYYTPTLTYTIPSGTTSDIVANPTGTLFGLGVSHLAIPSAGSAVSATTGALSASTAWSGQQFTIEPAVACPTITSQCVCPNGAGLPGVCECGSTIVSTLLSCFVVPAGTNETAMVTDGSGSCAPGTTPASGGTIPFSVAWSGTAWVCN